MPGEPAPSVPGRQIRTIALVGLMGSGKSTIGRRLARALGLPFRDADAEIEKAAGRTVAEIFAEHGEAEFRRGERKVIARLVGDAPHVLATGGGAFMDEETRTLLKRHAVTVWLKADVDVLAARVSRRATRPLLAGRNPRAVLEGQLRERGPVYALADLTVDAGKGAHAEAVDAIVAGLARLARPAA